MGSEPSAGRARAPAVEVGSLVKRFGDTTALAGLELGIERGELFGLLGPNGAGKTTLVRVLATLLRPDAGVARVLGLDVVTHAAEVRPLIGLAGQYAAVDELLTGRENLRMFGRLFHLGRHEAARRADDLLARFDLEDAADRRARTYSGGMRRRLDLASSLLTRPRLLFLDEPTTGLDPRSRGQIWEMVRELRAAGTTVLLTTQYLEEADQLADRIAVIDHGRVIAQGTGDQLKDQIGGRMLEVHLADAADHERAAAALIGLGCGADHSSQSDSLLAMPAPRDGVTMVADAAQALSAAGIAVSELALRRPTLDDVFLELTGERPVPAADESADAAAAEAATPEVVR